jgi:outer membrane receptor protein involved in Fe transport
MRHFGPLFPKAKNYLCFVSLILSLGAAAQVQNGQITGTVADPSGAVVARAKIIVQNLGTGYEINVQTNDTGIYTANELNVGAYMVRVEASGFKTAKASNLVLNAGTVLRIDFKLQLGEHSEIVDVTDAAASVNVENSRLSQTTDSTQIANLPLNGRNIYDLIQYAPGATNTRGVIFELGGNTVVNGVRGNFNGFLLNGVSNKALSGGPVNQPIQDTVQEFQLLTLNNSAEFGNSAGAITNLVTKSGTNQLHGSAWEFFRNDALDANPFFANHDPDPANRKRTPLHLNQFGATLGGPIKKERLFFFVGYQGDRFIISNPSPVQVESSQFRSATISAFPNNVSSLLYSHFAPSSNGTPLLTLRDYVSQQQSGSGFASFADYLCPTNTDSTGAIARQFATLFGVEQADIDQMNQGGCPGGSIFGAPEAGAFNRDDHFLVNVLDPGKSRTSGNLFNGNEASLRLDYNLSEKNRVFTQFNWSRSGDEFFPSYAPLRGFHNPSTVTTPNFQFNYIRTFAPAVVNEFRAGYTENGFMVVAGNPGVPVTYIFDSFNTMFFGSQDTQSFRESIYTYADSVSVSHGKHNLKIGADLRRNLENSYIGAGRPSYYFFDPLFFAIDAPYREAAGVDPGIVSGRPAHLSDNVRHFRNWEVGTFAQDDWKVTRRLTLNLGLRYDLFTRHTELNHLTTTFLKGPGHSYIDNISTGAGQIKASSTPCPGNPLGTIAGICGPGGFAPLKTLGSGDHTDFGPRIGFAWDMFGSGKSSLRGGFGVSYEGTLYNLLSDTRWNPPFYSLTGASNFLGGEINKVVYGPVGGGAPTFSGPAPQQQNSGTGAQATGNISGWDPANPQLALGSGIVFPVGFRDPYVENWFLGIQHEIQTGLTVEVDYVGTAGRKLFRPENVNRIPGARLPEGTCVKDNFGRRLCSQINTNMDANGFEINPRGLLNPNFGTLRVFENAANSIYHGLQISTKKRMRHGLEISGNYTYSHAIDSGSTWHNGDTTANGLAAGDSFTTDFTLPQLDRGNSTFDVRHRLTFNYVWQLPFFRQAHGFAGGALGGWQWNGIWSFQSGAHWTPFKRCCAGLPVFHALVPGACSGPTFDPTNCVNVGSDYNLDGQANDRPNAIANNVQATHDQWANGFNLPANFFSAPCLGCVGNLGRNTFVGPGYWNFDTSLFKNFHVSDRFALQFRVEAFNVFNHTSFQLGDNNIKDPFFGQASGTFPPRNLQLGLKLSF